MSLRLAYQDSGAATSGELRLVLRSVTEIDALLLVLTVLYLFIAGGNIESPVLYMTAIAVYGAFVLTLRFVRLLDDHPREKLVGAAAAMVLFITCVLAFCGSERGPLLNLYLLPIVTSALTLGRGATMLTVMLVLAGRVSLSHFVEGQDVLTLAYGLALLAEAVPVSLVALLTTTLAEDIHDANERLETMSEQDDLTGVFNIQAFTRLMADELARALRRGNNFALLLVDIDDLKSLNDRYGHEAGNRALVAVAQALKRSSRSVDLVARYGGDEFVLFLSGAGPAVAKVVGNRIRHNVATTTLEFGGNLHRVTVSIGAAVFPANGRDLRDLINAADRAVGQDKESRRPLVRSATALRA